MSNDKRAFFFRNSTVPHIYEVKDDLFLWSVSLIRLAVILNTSTLYRIFVYLSSMAREFFSSAHIVGRD